MASGQGKESDVLMFYPADLTSTLQSIPWFLDLNPDQLERIAEITILREIRGGENLFCEGEKDDFLYIVLEGKIAVDIFVPSRGQVRIFTAEPLDIFGWSSLTPVVRQRTATARAILCSRVAAIEAKSLHRLCEEDHHIGYLIMRRLANVVASRLLTTRLQLLDLIAHPDHEKNSIRSISE
jgi:CRP/FNR family cyclic AMP-dependent transcriptional regulator